MALTLGSLSKSFGGKRVIANFSHQFFQGKTYCLMGESGCGKTTLLNLIMGVLTPDEGEISGIPEKISAVFQEDRLCEDFTPVGNLLAVCDKGADLEKIGALLEELGLEEHKTKPVKHLSGGQKRRVAIARALCVESDMVLMDEPFKGLDEELKEKVIKTVLEKTKGKTLIVATHDVNECNLLNAEIINFQ